jgi:glutamine amidotransferase
MCRLAGYLGEPLSLSALLDAAPHALHRQSYAAKLLESAVVCADGWGAAWYAVGDEAPCLYRCTLPIWADVNRSHLGRAIRSQCLLAAVRSATDPLTVSHANTQPFAHGRLSVVHNGYVQHFAQRLMVSMRAELSATRQAELAGSTDSEHFAALLADEHARLPAASPREQLTRALRAAVERFERLVRKAETSAILTVVVADGEWIAGVRSAVGGEPPSLYLRARTDGVMFASEPLDDETGWTSVGERRLVVAGRAGVVEEGSL